jgi:hypothetical protein
MSDCLKDSDHGHADNEARLDEQLTRGPGVEESHPCHPALPRRSFSIGGEDDVKPGSALSLP